MKTLFQPIILREIKQRVENLQPTSQRQWGKMNVAQMMAHCNAAFEVANGEKFPPRMFIGRLLGPLLKPVLTNDKPLKRNTPTEKTFVFTDQRDFDTEKTKLMSSIDRFSSGGEAKVTRHPHPFFGKLTPDQWSSGMFKHLDHHLKQFGV
ncbi:MAG TPA: DUF1569 domain-containing protein [Segetibacter sp.]|jgi:hypothetical protein